MSQKNTYKLYEKDASFNFSLANLTLEKLVYHLAKLLAERQSYEYDYAISELRNFLLPYLLSFENSNKETPIKETSILGRNRILSKWLVHKETAIKDFLFFQKQDPDLFLKNLEEHIEVNKPLAYFFEGTFFLDNFLYVNSSVLIPRSDSEIIVYEVATYLKKRLKSLLISGTKERLSVLELCTGSGALSLGVLSILKDEFSIDILEKYLLWEASDISCEALAVASKNAKNYDKKQLIKWLLSDCLEKHKQKYDIIFLNPPYIGEKERVEIDRMVLDNEPHLALFAGEDGLAFYKKFFKELNLAHLKSSSLAIFLEIGYRQAGEVKALFTQSTFATTLKEKYLKKDLASNNSKNLEEQVEIKTIKDFNDKDRVVAIFLEKN